MLSGISADVSHIKVYQAVKLQKGEARRCFNSANLQGMGAGKGWEAGDKGTRSERAGYERREVLTPHHRGISAELGDSIYD